MDDEDILALAREIFEAEGNDIAIFDGDSRIREAWVKSTCATLEVLRRRGWQPPS